MLTLTPQGVERAERVARDQGLASQQKAWSGLVKPGELQHDVAVFRAARIEQMKLLEQGAVLKRIRIEAELKREIARATENLEGAGREGSGGRRPLRGGGGARSARQGWPGRVPGRAA